MAGYCRLGDIAGESQDAGHQGWINLLSVSHQLIRNLDQGASGSTRFRPSVTVGNLVLTKELDASTPKLIESVCDGRVFSEAQVELCTSTGHGSRVTYFSWLLQNVFVTNYFVASEGNNGEPPTETLALNFEVALWMYHKLDKQGESVGRVEARWQVEEGMR